MYIMYGLLSQWVLSLPLSYIVHVYSTVLSVLRWGSCKTVFTCVHT